MRAIIVKARDSFKVGDEINVEATEFVTLSEEGVAVTATEWAAMQRVKATDHSRIKDAVAAAKVRLAVPPKDEAVQATAIQRYDEGQANADVLVEMINAMQGTNDAAHRTDTRITKPVNDEGNSIRSRWEISRVSIEDAAQGVIKATEPQNALIRAGNFAEARKLSGEAATILKHNLMSIHAEGGDFLLRDTVKAATFSDPNSQVGALAGDLILMRNLGFLKNKLNWMKYFSTDLSGEPAKFGQAVLTRYITPPGVLTWVPGVGFTSDAQTISDHAAGTTQSGATVAGSAVVQTKSVPSTTDKSVTLNMFKATEVEFPVSTLASTMRNLFAEQLGAQTYSLAEAINQYVMTTMFAATWSGIKTSYTKGLANWNLSGMVGIKNAMTISKIPDVGRFLLMHSFYHDKLLEDSNMLTAKAILSLVNKDQSAFESGELPVLYGVKPLESQLASATAAGALTTWQDDTNLGTTNIVGLAGNMSSMLFVSRAPQDYTSALTSLGIPATASIRLVTEPDSGLTVMVFSYADNGKMSISQRVCVMWGAAQGDPRQGILLKAA